MGVSHSQFTQPEYRTLQSYTVDSLIKASQSQVEDYTPAQRQQLEERLSGLRGVHRQTIRKPWSLRYEIILEYCTDGWEDLSAGSIITNKLQLQWTYIRYIRAIDQETLLDGFYKYRSEPPSKAVVDAFLSLDFWRARQRLQSQGACETHLELLKDIEEFFKSRLVSPEFRPVTVMSKYGTAPCICRKKEEDFLSNYAN